MKVSYGEVGFKLVVCFFVAGWLTVGCFGLPTVTALALALGGAVVLTGLLEFALPAVDAAADEVVEALGEVLAPPPMGAAAIGRKLAVFGGCLMCSALIFGAFWLVVPYVMAVKWYDESNWRVWVASVWYVAVVFQIARPVLIAVMRQLGTLISAPTNGTRNCAWATAPIYVFGVCTLALPVLHMAHHGNLVWVAVVATDCLAYEMFRTLRQSMGLGLGLRAA